MKQQFLEKAPFVIAYSMLVVVFLAFGYWVGSEVLPRFLIFPPDHPSQVAMITDLDGDPSVRVYSVSGGPDGEQQLTAKVQCNGKTKMYGPYPAYDGLAWTGITPEGYLELAMRKPGKDPEGLVIVHIDLRDPPRHRVIRVRQDGGDS